MTHDMLQAWDMFSNFKGYTNFVTHLICPCLAPSTGCALKVGSVAFPFSYYRSSFVLFCIFSYHSSFLNGSILWVARSVGTMAFPAEIPPRR